MAVNITPNRATIDFRNVILNAEKDLVLRIDFEGGGLSGTITAPDGFWLRKADGTLTKTLTLSEIAYILDDSGNPILDDSGNPLLAD